MQLPVLHHQLVPLQSMLTQTSLQPHNDISSCMLLFSPVGCLLTPHPPLPSYLLPPLCSASMGGMIAQELALLLLDRSRLASLGLAVTCRGLRPLGGLLAPLFSVRLLAPLLGWWYAYDAQRLVERLMAKLLTREVLAARHPTTGQTLETVRGRGVGAGNDQLLGSTWHGCGIAWLCEWLFHVHLTQAMWHMQRNRPAGMGGMLAARSTCHLWCMALGTQPAFCHEHVGHMHTLELAGFVVVIHASCLPTHPFPPYRSMIGSERLSIPPIMDSVHTQCHDVIHPPPLSHTPRCTTVSGWPTLSSTGPSGTPWRAPAMRAWC